jgi:hypothetical protein
VTELKKRAEVIKGERDPETDSPGRCDIFLEMLESQPREDRGETEISDSEHGKK